MLEKEFTWKTNDQLSIYAKHWGTKSPKAVVCLVHGLGEHIMRYEHLASYFNQHDIVVLGNDRRGHGQSDGKRGHCIKYDDFLMEVKHLIATAKAHYSDLPIFIYGHSMGGNIVLNYIINNQPKLAGVIVTGAWIRLGSPPPAWKYPIAKVAMNIVPSLVQPNELDTAGICTDPKVVQAYENDPLVHDQITLKTGVSMLDAAKRLDEFTGNLSMPILIMHGERDSIILATGSTDLANRIESEVELKIWDNLFHEIHNEPNQKEIFDYSVRWIEKIMG